MSNPPLLSYIVLSYNYAQYIGTTIRSILDQTVQDFEIVVVDDASKDASVEVIRSFSDSRIKLLINDQNLGGAGSYNRAVNAARGEWLVNLDADDWISPNKSERQLAEAAADSGLDIIGTYVKMVDSQGAPHPLAGELEAIVNAPHELGLVDSWIGTNNLCRSSTMVRRATHLRIGLDDTTMVRAPDYELWTRSLREGCRFLVVPEPLTYIRLLSGGVTHGDPLGTMLEVSYAMLRNLIPLCDAGALNQSLKRIVSWTASHPQLSALRPIEAYRLLGMLMTTPSFDNFADFRASLSANEEPLLAQIGRRCMILSNESALRLLANNLELHVKDLKHALQITAESRDFWRVQAKETALWGVVRLVRRAYSHFFRSL